MMVIDISLAASSFDPGVLMAWLIVGAGTILVFVFFLHLPRRRSRELEASLRKLGIASDTRAQTAHRPLLVPVATDALRSALVEMWAAIPEANPPAVAGQTITLTGRSRRFLNVNRVNPLDFSSVELACERLSDTATRLSRRVTFAGYWRAVVVMSLFTIFAAAAVAFGHPSATSRFWIFSALAIFAVFFLLVRYLGQRWVTNNFLDGLLLEAAARVRNASR